MQMILPSSEVTERLARLRAKALAAARAHYASILLAATALFVVGGWYSFRQLHVTLGQLHILPLALLICAGPVSLIYSGLGLLLMSRSVGTALPLGRAITLSTYANLAEALPLPGGAIVRTGALVTSGAGLKVSSAVVILSAIMWIALAALGCGVALYSHGHAAALAMIIFGTCGTALSAGWLAARAGGRNALLTALHRIAGLIVIGVRLHLGFLVLGMTLRWADALPFALATVAGSAASIAPAGLGVSELLAAGVAGTVAVAPAAAFLAVGIDRVIMLGTSAIYVLARLALSKRVQA